MLVTITNVQAPAIPLTLSLNEARAILRTNTSDARHSGSDTQTEYAGYGWDDSHISCARYTVNAIPQRERGPKPGRCP